MFVVAYCILTASQIKNISYYLRKIVNAAKQKFWSKYKMDFYSQATWRRRLNSSNPTTNSFMFISQHIYLQEIILHSITWISSRNKHALPNFTKYWAKLTIHRKSNQHFTVCRPVGTGLGEFSKSDIQQCDIKWP